MSLYLDKLNSTVLIFPFDLLGIFFLVYSIPVSKNSFNFLSNSQLLLIHPLFNKLFFHPASHGVYLTTYFYHLSAIVFCLLLLLVDWLFSILSLLLLFLALFMPTSS